MKGIFVNENGCVPYAALIASGIKTIETRNRNMLSACVGERVAVIRTHRNWKPLIVGYVTITGSSYCKAEDFDKYYRQHCVSPVSGFAPQNGRGKWFYYCADAETCYPKDLPENIVRHGRSWCEWDDDVLDILRKAEAAENAMTDEEWNHLHDGEVHARELF